MRILILEEDARTARELRKGLEQDRWVVDLALDEEQGLRLAGEKHYDVLVLGQDVTSRHGTSVVGKFRESAPGAKIIYLSGNEKASDRMAALVAGADDYLAKPFSPEELRNRLGSVSGLPDGLSNGKDQGELVRVRRIVTQQGKCLKLNPRESAAFEFLKGNADQTVKEAMVAENAWHLGFAELANVVEAYIDYLRTRIRHGAVKSMPHKSNGKTHANGSSGRSTYAETE